MFTQLGFQPAPREQDRIDRALGVIARIAGCPGARPTINWAMNSASSIIISASARAGRRHIVKLAKERINFSEHLHCPIWRSWNEYVWTHTANLEGYASTLAPLYASASDGFLVLPELERERFGDLRAMLINGDAEPGFVLDIFRGFVDVQRRLDATWHGALPFRCPEAVFFKFRIVPHFFAIMVKYRCTAIPPATENVMAYLLNERRKVIHGDFSPKNVLVGNGSHYLIDAESAGLGNEDFDPLFFLSQLLIETSGRADRGQWNEMVAEALDLHFGGAAPDAARATICASTLATMMLARL